MQISVMTQSPPADFLKTNLDWIGFILKIIFIELYEQKLR